MTVHLKEDAGTDTLHLPEPSAFPLDDGSGARLRLRGDFPNYYVTNGCCGCGSIERSGNEEGHLVPVRFVSDLLSVFPVGSVELLWWYGNEDDRPLDPPRRPVSWSEFVQLNNLRKLEGRTAYLIGGKPARSGRA